MVLSGVGCGLAWRDRYCTLCVWVQWDTALGLAQARNHPGASELRAEYFGWLMQTEQLELAGTP